MNNPEEKNFALVTGGSSGIGLAYAEEWAQKGYNILIVSNREDLNTEAQNYLQPLFPEVGRIDGGAKQGRDPIAQQAHRELSSEIGKQRRIEAQAIPDPEIRVHPAELMGDIDPGRWDYKIQTAEKADVTFNRGHIRIYLEDPGSIHSWVSEGHYDIYA